MKKAPVVYKGETYPTEKKLIESLDMKYLTVKQAQLRAGVSLIEYLEGLETGRFKRTRFEYKGVTYNSITEAVHELLPDIKVSKFTVKKNKLGISVEECLDRFLAGEFSVTIDGVQYDSVADCLRKNDLARNDVINMYRQSKENYQEHYNLVEFVEKVLRGEVIINPQKVEFDGKEFDSIRDLIETRYNYQRFYTLKQKLKANDSLELFTNLVEGNIDDSSVLPTNPPVKRTKLEFDGDNHKNLTELLKEYGHTYHDYRRILNEGKASDMLTYLDYRAENPVRKRK